MKKIGCLHAHHSNVAYIDKAFTHYQVELIHFVDPGLIKRISLDPGFNRQKIAQKIYEQLTWIADCGVDAILITCTNYIAELPEEVEQALAVPVIKLDEPFFASLSEVSGIHRLLFTNPATVAGTMARLEQYATRHGYSLLAEGCLIEHAFELVMQNKTAEYTELLAKTIRRLHSEQPGYPLAVAQLSMVEAAEQMEQELGIAIGNPLQSLTAFAANALDLHQ